MNPINVNISQPSQRPQQQPQTPRSLLTQAPGPFDWLAPQTIAQAAARLLMSVGGGLVAGAIGRCVQWGPQSIALALIFALALAIGLGFLWRADRRGCWIALAYFLFGVIGASMAIGFGGEG